MAEEFDKEQARGDAHPEEIQHSGGISPQPAQEGGQEENAADDLFYWLHALVMALVCLVLVFTFLGRLTRVDGHSMDNTLQHNELLLVWSLGYQPGQGDIVIVNKTPSAFLHGDAIVKRVIATGGQTVDIDYETGTLYVDGQPLDEPYIRETMGRPNSTYMQQTHWEVPQGSIFVMGDNRNDSTDSRDERLGAVDEDYVLGRAVVSIWPLTRIGLL